MSAKISWTSRWYPPLLHNRTTISSNIKTPPTQISNPSSRAPNCIKTSKIHQSNSFQGAGVALYRHLKAWLQRAVWKMDRSKKLMLRCSLRNQPNILDSRQRQLVHRHWQRIKKSIRHQLEEQRPRHLLWGSTSQALPCSSKSSKVPWCLRQGPQHQVKDINYSTPISNSIIKQLKILSKLWIRSIIRMIIRMIRIIGIKLRKSLKALYSERNSIAKGPNFWIKKKKLVRNSN